MYEDLRTVAYDGSYDRVSAFVRNWKKERDSGAQRSAFVPLAFEYGEAFQFDWVVNTSSLAASGDGWRLPT